MTLRKLDPHEWFRFFDHVSERLLGKRAEIEIASLEVGAQVLTEWLPIVGIFYDPKDDFVEIALEGFEHRVYRPREIYIDEPPLGWGTLGLVDWEGALRIVRLREPLMLPAVTSF